MSLISQPSKIFIYYLNSNKYDEIKKGLRKFVKDNNSVYLETSDNDNIDILFGYIGINGNPHTKDGIADFDYYFERERGTPGVFTTDGTSFYEIIDFRFTVDEKVLIKLQRIKEKSNSEDIKPQKLPNTKKKRITISFKNRSLLQKEINSECPFCDSRDVDHFQVHHIDENSENNQLSNLLMICPLCHSKITKGDISQDEVINKKQVLKQDSNKMLESPLQQINYGNNSFQLVNSPNVEINQNTTKVYRNIVQPTSEHVSEQEAYIIKKLIDEIVEVEFTTSKGLIPKSKLFRKRWNKLTARYEITSYKLIPKEKFVDAETWLRQQKAMLRPKLRRTDKTEWKNQQYTAIYTKAKSLNLTKEDVYQLAFQKLSLPKYITSLKELKDNELKKFYEYIMRIK